ncbi:hypothetical protein [Bradyrhizobium sp.]|uniref:hypothetical protein n=1 Tax=Bradyrhizobium sp. TaxID=376 RepID=UPI0034143A6C
MAFYAPDASVLWPAHPIARGHAEIRKVWQAAYKSGPTCVSSSTRRTSKSPAVATWRAISAWFVSRRTSSPTTPRMSANISWSGNASTAPGKCFAIATT